MLPPRPLRSPQVRNVLPTRRNDLRLARKIVARPPRFDRLNLAVKKITTGAVCALGRTKIPEILGIERNCTPRDDLMIKTLYVKGDEADRCTESFRSGVPITITGIDASDEHKACTGAITSMEYAPMPTEHDGRQWRVTIRT
jgi:hypothetical protein